MDYNFDDILKEFGVEPDSPPADSYVEEKTREEAVFAPETGEEAFSSPEAGEEEYSHEAEEAPSENSQGSDMEDDPFAAWAAIEESLSEKRPAARGRKSAADRNEFHFDWPEENTAGHKSMERVRQPSGRATLQDRTLELQRREKQRVRADTEPQSREEKRAKAEQERLSRQRREAEEQDQLRARREQEKTEKLLRKEREKAEAKASRDARRRAELNARDASREAKYREKEETRENRRREKEAYNRRHFQERRQGRIGFIIFLIVILMTAGGVFYAGNAIAKSGRNMPNVYVDDIPVGNLTRQQTRDVLLSAGWQERASTPLVVKTYNGLSVEINPTDAGTVMPLDAAVDAACGYGHDGNLIENVITYVQSFLNHVDVNRINTVLNSAYVQQKASELGELLTDSLGDTPYTVDVPGEKLVVTKGQGTMALDIRGLYDAIASAITHGDTELTFTQLASEPVMPDFNAIYTQLAADPVDARYSDDGRFTVIPETVGCWFDVEGAQSAWQQAQPGETFTIPVQVTVPATTAAMLEGRLYHDLLGAMTTKYTNSSENRCSNVRLATSILNGTILYPGEVLSYNETVGARTLEAGFLPAPAYTGVGEDSVKDEIGGGACQVSSTLYCASIYAFLETVERTAHIYPVNYIQMGTDATVTIPEDGGNVMDLKFRNSKNYPIKIVGYTEETEELKTVTFEIWGTLEEDDYMPVEFDNSYYWMMDYDRVIEPAYPDREGYKIKFTHERYGFEDAIGYGTRTLTHREVYDSSGAKILDEIINPKIASGYAMDTYYNHG